MPDGTKDRGRRPDGASVYPAAVRGSGVKGRVVLDELIKTDGTVEVL